jgi:hypothetical protein
LTETVPRLPSPSKSRRFGLSCEENQLTLAGVPLLRRTGGGLAPRPPFEIKFLMKAAYLDFDEETRVSRGLGVIANALNRNDRAKASMAAAFLRLADLDLESAVRVAHADDALSKYDPDQPRDWHGRWMTDEPVGETDGSLATAPSDQADILTDVAYYGQLHDKLVRFLANACRAKGGVAITETRLIAANGAVARVDVILKARSNDPVALAIEVKTLKKPQYRTNQSSVYEMAMLGGHVISPDQKIEQIGYSPNTPLPPMIWITVYQRDEGSAPKITVHAPGIGASPQYWRKFWPIPHN